MNVDRLPGHDVKNGKFGFSGRCHDEFDDVGNVQDGSIVGWDFRIGGEKECPPARLRAPGLLR